MQAACPIHPELFDRLFNDWSALDKFQRTRGVLRLMAAVIHALWEREDKSLLILPSSVPIDAGPVQFELTRYLDENWVPVIERDVDGPQSLPLQQDRENPNLGRYSASRRLAQDRAGQFSQDEVWEEIRSRLRDESRTRADFTRIQPIPGSSGDVPDEQDARLVILGPDYPHNANNESSPARVSARDILDHRGSSPRIYRNTLLFLAPDKTRLAELEQAVRQYLAWKSIEAEREQLNLDAFQSNQAKTQRTRAEEAVSARIPESYIWLLEPEQPDKTAGLEWREIRLQGQEPLAVRASKRLRNDELLVTTYAGTLLRMELDRIPLWRGDHVLLKQLADDFAQYLYLPRLKDTDVLLGAVQNGLGMFSWELDSFAYAQGYDEATGRYRGLTAGQGGNVALDGSAVLVKPSAANQQFAADRAKQETAGVPAGGGYTSSGGDRNIQVTEGAGTTTVVKTLPRRFHGSASLDASRAGRDMGRIAEEVLQHLNALIGADVEVTLEIQARVPEGVPENVVRTITENCRVLKFDSHGFEEE